MPAGGGVGGGEELGRDAERIVGPAGKHKADCRQRDPEWIGHREDATRARIDCLTGKHSLPQPMTMTGVPGRCSSKALTHWPIVPGMHGRRTFINPSETEVLIDGLISPRSEAATTSVLENAACRTSAKHSRVTAPDQRAPTLGHGSVPTG